MKTLTSKDITLEDSPYRGVVVTIIETPKEWNPYGSAWLIPVLVINYFVAGVLLSGLCA